MADNFYEKHSTSSSYPFVFHTDTLHKSGFMTTDGIKRIIPQFRAHWHENIELLYVLEGEFDIITNAVKVHACPGDIAVVNSNMVHKIIATTDKVVFHCLIIDVGFCKDFGFDIENTVFTRRITGGNDTQKLYLNILKYIDKTASYVMFDLKIAILSLVLDLLKHHTDDSHTYHQNSNPKAETVKRAIEYMKLHFAEPLTVTGISEALGFTKCYFCHTFKEITGDTAISHLNYIRCKNAKSLILSGHYNINEAAEMSGFTNMSYFSKTYRNVMGESPSKTKSRKNT